MRLINADALKKLRRCEIDEYADGWTFKELWEAEEADIDSLPAIAPKRGKWMRTESTSGWEKNYYCSECRCEFFVETCMLKPTWNYCPNCGALMREDGGEG